MCDWFEVDWKDICQVLVLVFKDGTMVIFEHFFSDLGAQGEVQETYLCTSTKPSPPRHNELRKKGEENSGQAI